MSRQIGALRDSLPRSLEGSHRFNPESKQIETLETINS